MTKQDKPAEQQGDTLTPEAVAAMRELGYSAQQIEAERQAAERIKAAGGFSSWAKMSEAARIASEARGYPVGPENFTVARFPDARAKLDSMAGVRHRTSIVGWADAFALELAILNGKCRADRMHAHRLEQAMLQAARKGVLRMRTFDAVGAPVEVTADMAEDVITQRLATDTEDVRAWADQHWPELAESRLLAEPQAAPAVEAVTESAPFKMGNSTKGKRAQPLAAEIEAAKREATNPDDYLSVFAVLQRHAELRKPPFLGFVEGEGCKYQTPSGVDIFTRDALRKRIKRATNAR